MIPDTKMPFLPEITDVDQIQDYLRQVLGNRIPDIGNYTLQSADLIRHKPGRRALVEYTFYRQSDDTDGASLTFIGKARANGPDMRTWNLNRALFEQGFCSDFGDNIEIPEPVGVGTEYRMWLQRKVAGVNPFNGLVQAPDNKLAKRIAGAIFKLHSGAVPIARDHTIQDELAILERALDNVAMARPEWRERLGAIKDRSRKLAATIPEAVNRCLHRDFYHDQLLIDGDKTFLLDLDLCSMGDPALDIGNFTAHIREQCLREFGDPDAAASNVDAFISQYCRLSGQDMRKTIEAYALLSMARHIFISQRIPDRQRFMPQILTLCETGFGQFNL